MYQDSDTTASDGTGSRERSDNELIAEFMGIEVHPYVHWSGQNLLLIPNEGGILDWPDINQYCPDVDWNDLMPVVEKIISNGYEYRSDAEETSFFNSITEDYIVVKRGGKAGTYEAVIEHINNQKQQSS